MKKLWSIFTKDMNHCMFTGTQPVERHHCFYNMGGKMKERCEKYGFIAPLRPDLHPNGVHAGQGARLVDIELKKRCQMYYELHYGSRDEFISEFGKSYF